MFRLALLPCMAASPRALPAQVPADTTPVLHSWRRTLPYRRGVVIWVANQGQESVRIRAVTVSRCLNIGAGCGTTPLSLQLAPGDSATALIIRPRLWDDRYVYTLSWEWETGAPAAPAPGGCGSTSETAPAIRLLAYGSETSGRHTERMIS